MPGKVNPVMCESVMMVCAQVIGNDTCITWAGANGNFELNVMMPVMAHDLLESIRLLGNVVDVFCDKCIKGIVANEERCRRSEERRVGKEGRLGRSDGATNNERE